MLKFFKKAPHTTKALKYAYRVITGKRKACIYEIAACKRFIDDFKRLRGFEYDIGKAERSCRFVEKMPHIKGKWAAKKLKLTLTGWQCFVVCNLFGWVDKDGLRRFREAYMKIARKNGKSTVCAGIGQLMFTADGEYGAEVYSGASTLHQSWEVFGPARLMALKNKKYCDKYGIEIGARNMNIQKNNSKFEPLIGNPGDGANPSCAIIDEYHQHLNNNLYETMQTGMGSRDQPLMIVITTAGSNMGGPCYDAELEAKKVLDKVFKDERLFVLIFGIDDDDDWTDKKNLEKANPNMGVSISRAFLEGQLKHAIRSPAKQNAYKRKHLNQWVGAHTAWLNMVDFLKCADESLNLDDFVTDDCYLPIDLASKIDITATPKLFVRVIDDKIHYYLFGKYYIPEETMFKDENKHYQAWHNAGHLIATDGNEIDFNEIQRDIKEDHSNFNVKECPYDPWRATQLAQGLQSEGANVVEFRNTTPNMSPAMYELEAAIAAGRFHYDGNPVTTWMASNVIARVDAKDNVYPRKQKTENKIDGIVATIMGIGRVIYAVEEEKINIDAFLNNPIAG